MELRDCSKILFFFKIGAFIIAFKRNINSRIYPTEKCREKDGVIRHIDVLIWPTLSKRFAFALYQPWLILLQNVDELCLEKHFVHEKNILSVNK